MLSKAKILRAKENISLQGSDPKWCREALAKWVGEPDEVLAFLEQEGWIEIKPDCIRWVKEITADKDLYIIHLEQQLHQKKKKITELLDTVNRFAKRLDAMWWVWCDGSCEFGVARWGPERLSEEIIKIAERNTERLKRKWKNLAYYREKERTE
jgi:hypothetical protein